MVFIQSFPKSLFKYALIVTLPEKKPPVQGLLMSSGIFYISAHTLQLFLSYTDRFGFNVLPDKPGTCCIPYSDQ